MLTTDHSSGVQSSSRSGHHLVDYLGVILNRLKLASSVFILTVGLGLLYSFTRTPLYRAVSRILIEPTSVDITDVKSAMAMESNTGRQTDYLPTQLKLITSRPVIESVLTSAELLKDEEFRNALDPQAMLLKNIDVEQVRGSRLIDVSCTRANPGQAARVVNAIVDTYIQSNRQRRLGVSKEGIIELQKKADELRAKLDLSNKTLQDFYSTNGIVSFDQASRVLEDRVRGLNENLWRAEPLRLKLKAEVDTAQQVLKEGKSIENLPSVVSNHAVTSLTVEYVKMGITDAEMRSRLGDNHPQVQAFQAQRDAMRKQIGLVASSVLESLKVEYEQATQEASLLREALSLTVKDVEKLNDLGATVRLLSKNLGSAQDSYQRVLQRIEEINLNQLGVQGENVFVIFPATTPSAKSFPNHAGNLILSIFLGALLAVTLCFFLDYMDRSIKNIGEAQSIYRAPFLGSIPVPTPDEIPEGPSPDFTSLNNTSSQMAEAFRIIRSSLLSFDQNNQTRSFVVTSAVPEEGKSHVCINLALAYAFAGKKVLLVDGDLRKPRIHSAFSLGNSQGFSDILLGKIPVQDFSKVIQACVVENLKVITSGSIPSNPAELLDGPTFREFLRIAQTTYDLVIFDSPPGLHLIDSILLAKNTNGVVLVVRLHSTPAGAARFFSDRLLASHARLLGLLTNHIDVPSMGHFSYYYGGAYGRYKQDNLIADADKSSPLSAKKS